MRMLNFAVACLGSGLVFAAHEASAQFYLSGSAGVQQIKHYSQNYVVDLGPPIGAAAADVRIDINPGFLGTVAAGYKFANYDTRIEIEAGYERAIYDSLHVDTQLGDVFSPLPGTAQIYTGAVNVFYDVPTGTFIWPYFGVGLGAAREKFTAFGIPLAGGGTVTFGQPNWVTNFLVQGELGFSVRVANGLTISPAFRYQHIVDETDARFGDTQIFAFRVGVGYSF